MFDAVLLEEYVILVADGRAITAKQQISTNNTVDFVPVSNWQELEGAAWGAVKVQGGGADASGTYLCPGWLRLRAQE